MKRIFVQMVSYRDAQCHHTLADLFAKAACPERISVGLCWQYDPEEDRDAIAVPYPRPGQVRVVQFHVRDAQGAGWARGEAQKLYAGEDYILQVQAHMRFEQGWDETLIALLEGLPTPRAVLTAWLPGYVPPEEKLPLHGQLPVAVINRFGGADDPQILHLGHVMLPQERVDAPFLTGMWVGNFLFCRAQVLKDVPPDPHIYFWGEELSYSARLWTHGYDIYHLNQVVLYHYWDREEQKDQQQYRDITEARNRQSLARVQALLGLGAAQKLGIYGLGKTRSLVDYFRFLGVDMTRKLISASASRGRFGEAGNIHIFVAIAAYRDEELTHTLADLFDKAAHPERIHVGICEQLDAGDEPCVVPQGRQAQVQILRVDATQSKGANWARAQAVALAQDEDFILQTDSHMRFAEGWDEILLQLHQRAPQPRCAITAYLPNYTPPDTRDTSPGHILRLCVRRLGAAHDPQLVHLTGRFVPQPSPQEPLAATPFAVANFLFAPREVWQDVPLDPHIPFYGDEITLSARLWTYGIDLWQPDCVVAYHWWQRPKQPYRTAKSEAASIANARVRHLLGLEASDDTQALEDIGRYGLGDVRSLDSFWGFAGIDPVQGKMTARAKDGLWVLDQADSKGDTQPRQAMVTSRASTKKAVTGKSTPMPKKPRIFVQVAAYRDPECQYTIKDMFEKATHPERIFAGICWQFVREEDAVCFTVPYPCPDQVRVIEMDARESKGVCFARALVQTLWEGEEFTLQIDSHMRFEPGWDETLIDMWQGLRHPKAILTCYPPGYTPPDTLQKEYFFGMNAKEFDQYGILKMSGIPAYRPEKTPFFPMRGAYASGCMLFGPGRLIEDMPYDPHLYFFGEEITMAVRLWTHGYELFHPNKIVIYHDWDRGKRPTHFSDNPTTWWPQNLAAMERACHLLGTKVSTNPEVTFELEKYGFGTERTLAQYEAYSGVNFAHKHISERAKKGLYYPHIFVQIASYRDRECQHTIRDLFEKAAHPERIFVGICWQFDPEEDADCFELPYPRPDQVRVVNYHYKDSKGANWARVEAGKLRQGEEYTLLIDAHMRFEQDWDRAMVAMLEGNGTPKAVLTNYPASYTPPDKLHRADFITRMVYHEFDDRKTGIKLPTYRSKRVPEAEVDKPFLAATVSSCFIFARSQFFYEVPIDPHIYFFGDDLSLAVRGWTHGWDFYSPHRTVIYHLWDRTTRISHWDDHAHRKQQETHTRLRLCHLTGMQQTDNKQALLELDQYGLGTERSLQAFEHFSGVNFRQQTINARAQSGVYDGSMQHPRIFVQIASYRDRECQHTVKDLFEKAAHPERIFVGICWQFDKKEDAECFAVPYPYPGQVRVIEYDYRDAKGASWARAQAFTLNQDEEYTLAIDAHMRFEPGWDDMLLDQLAQCGSEKAVLSSYPSGYTPPNKLTKGYVCRMGFDMFKDDTKGHFPPTLRYKPIDMPQSEAPDAPFLAMTISNNFIFAPTRMFREVPMDPHIYFFGDDVTYAARVWTHGWDIYSPNKNILYHFWEREARRMHWDDHNNDGDAITRRRVAHMMGMEKTDNAQSLVEIEKYGLGSERSFAKYQQVSGVDFARRTISEKARRGIYTMSEPTIFVRIASYRDPECQHTVKDLFEKATHPDRIFVGICWQFDEKEDEHCFAISTRPEQVRIYPVDWRDSEGVCWARAQTEILFEDEDYTLQIDSHMRFVQGWDELMIAELEACGSPKAVLSNSPAHYTPPDQLEKNPRPTVRRVLPFNSQGNIRGRGELLDKEPPKPLPAAFVACGYVFSRGDVIHNVPSDPYLYFDNEEIVYAMRLYTHGYDMFSPRRQFLYHYYNDRKTPDRPLHWEDMKTLDEKKINLLTSRALERFNHISGCKPSKDIRALIEIEKYGLGNARTLAEYEAYSGVDFKHKITSPKALNCGFIPDLAHYRAAPFDLGREMAPKSQLQAVSLADMPITPTDRPYAVGDIMPYFVAEATDAQLFHMDKCGGKPTLLYFLPFSDPSGNAPFFRAYSEAMKEAGKMDAAIAFIFDASVAQLEEFKKKTKLPFMLMADPERRLAQTLGAAAGASAYLLSSVLQIRKHYANLSPAKLAKQSVEDLAQLAPQRNATAKNKKYVTENAPVLMLPTVLSPELCKELIAAFHAGPNFPGGVGSQTAVNTDMKVRQDYIVPDALRTRIDEALSRNLFPEIEKIFGFKVTHRENYKVGLYDGENKGFFGKHRDNFHPMLAYRRVAITLHLSDDYEGGGITFPEYDKQVYKPGAGGVVAFSCGMVHEALPVSKGERFVLVGFFHGEAEEQYRQHHYRETGNKLQNEQFAINVPDVQGIPLSRDFYTKWQREQLLLPPSQGQGIITPTAVQTSNYVKPLFGIGKEKHVPTKVYEGRSGAVFDNFLPPDIYEKVRNYCLTTDYEHINTKGKIARAWHVHDGFPLRSLVNGFYYADKSEIAMPKPPHAYPLGSDIDRFIEFMAEFQPQVEFYTGKPVTGWHHFSATCWLYPQGTGLSMHDDGSGVYTGAYAFFLNPVWRAHWGGMLVLMDDEANDMVHAHRRTVDGYEYHRQKWLHTNNTDELLTEHGLGRCIFPKGNRMVFIANDAYHMVTRVNEAAGDNIRVSIAGFFDRKKK